MVTEEVSQKRPKVTRREWSVLGLLTLLVQKGGRGRRSFSVIGNVSLWGPRSEESTL